MNHDVTRRDAFKVLASGAAGAVLGAGTPAEAAANGRAVETHALPAALPADGQPASYEVARKMAGMPAIPEANPPCLATVMHCRSWSREIYLVIDEQVRGFVTVTTDGFSLAAACQAAGRRVAVRYWGHDPRLNFGAGRFEGAVIAVELADFEDSSPSGSGRLA